jgi:hypothetical protein
VVSPSADRAWTGPRGCGNVRLESPGFSPGEGQADTEDVGDVPIALAGGKEAEHLNLVLTEIVEEVEGDGRWTWPLLKAGAHTLFKDTHPQFTGCDEGLAQQGHGLLTVTGLAAGQEHDSILILGVGQPGPCSHPSVHRQSVFEVALCILPVRHRGSEHPEIARRSAIRDRGGPNHDVVTFVWCEALV